MVRVAMAAILFTVAKETIRVLDNHNSAAVKPQDLLHIQQAEKCTRF